MARPIKEGLDYFPFSVCVNNAVELFEAEFGLRGFAVYVKLLQRVYSVHGYYMTCDKDVILMFTQNVLHKGVSVNFVYEVISCLIRRGIFDKGMYKEHGILTSRQIQLDYAAAKRGYAKINEAYSLINDTQKQVSAAKTPVSATKTPVFATETPHRLNKSKLVSLSIGTPTLEEVKVYAKERNSVVNAERFFNYYCAINWTVRGEPITDWKALFRSWEQSERPKAQSIQGNSSSKYNVQNMRIVKPTGFNNYEQRIYSDEELDEIFKRKKARMKK